MPDSCNDCCNDCFDFSCLSLCCLCRCFLDCSMTKPSGEACTPCDEICMCRKCRECRCHYFLPCHEDNGECVQYKTKCKTCCSPLENDVFIQSEDMIR